MGIFTKFQKGFQKGAVVLHDAFSKISSRSKIGDEDLSLIEEALFQADFGVETTEEIIGRIIEANKSNSNFQGEDATQLAREVIKKILTGCEANLSFSENSKPQVICLIGVNGSGKTTTSAKLGHQINAQGKKVLLGACDTFRAAATEQLRAWADRLELECVFGHHGADSASVAFDAYTAGLARGSDLVIIDTAGRLHNKQNLMDELSKLKRVLRKKDGGAPHHSWLVVDGSTGMNGLEQAKIFNEKFGLTGLVVTKLDGTSKGGVLVSIYRELKLPIFYLGLGENPDDLQSFSIEYYLDSVLPLSAVVD